MRIHVDPEKEFHVVINGAVTALSLDALAETYQADVISDETLIWQPGLDEWMRLDTLLAALSEQEDEPEHAPSLSTPAVHPSLYSVLLAPNDVRHMSLEALADGYRQGHAQPGTLVCEPGSSEWVPLSVVIARFSASPARPAPSVAQAVPQAPQLSHAAAPVAPMAPVPSAAPFAAPAPISTPAPILARAPSAPAALGSAPSALGSAPSAAPSAPNSLAPMAASIGPRSSPSVARMASPDLDLESLDLQALRGSKSPWLVRSLMGAGALALALVIYQGASASGGEETAQLRGVAAKATSAATAPEVEAEPSAWAKEQAMLKEADRLDAAAKAQASAFGSRLNGETKQEAASPAPARSKGQPKAKKKGPAASKSSEYDPMNGSL